MSRLLDALRHLQQTDDTSLPAPARKVTPRLSASIQKVVAGNAPPAPSAPEVLFRIPEDRTAAASPTLPVAPAVPRPATARVANDPLRLIEVIQASISSIHQEQERPTTSVAEPQPTPTPVEPPAPVLSPRPTATTAEAELRALLASEFHARPYREMLAMVQRDVGGKARPVVALVGLDGQESTEHVVAALGTLIAEQAKDHAVLLIDANPTRILAQRYAAMHAVGLTELLAGRIERPAAILPTSHERLDLLPFGLATAEQAQLLPAALPAAVQQARGTHAVVIDGGPISAPWALIASQAADAVYLVVRVGDTSAEQATSCVQRFRAAGGKLTGCIAVGPLPS